MTKLTRPVKRFACRDSKSLRRRLVVILEPGDMLALRQYGCRTTYRETLETVYWWMAKRSAVEEAKEVARLKRERRKQRMQ